MAFNFGTNQTHAGGGALIVPADAQLAISDQHVEALMGGHASTVPDTRRRNVTQPRLHDAYLGSNEFLANTMIDLLLTSDISFVTTELMPMFHHDDPLLKWKEISEDNGIMEPEQEGGVPSLKSSSMQEFSAYMQRFGRAAIFSHGFANTEGGRSMFRLRLGHMAKEIQRTLDIRGLYAIIASQKHYVRLFSNLPEDYESGGAVNAIDCFERELATFAMLQKNERGLYALDERLRRQLELNGANPDAWIMLSEMMSHCAMESAEVERYRAGPVGRIHLEKGKGSMASFRGCKVHAVKDYDVYGRAINAFKRTRMIGDFWPIRDFGYGKEFGPKFSMNQRCQTDVYCCGTDRFENFGLRAALQKCGVFEEMHADGRHFVYSDAMARWRDGLLQRGPGNAPNQLNEQYIKDLDALLLRETPLIYTVREPVQGVNPVFDVRLFNEIGNPHDVRGWLEQLHRAGRYVDPTAANQIFIGMNNLNAPNLNAQDLFARFFGLPQTPSGPSSDPAAPAKQGGTGTGQLIIATDEKSSHEVVKLASAMKGMSQCSDAAASIQQILSAFVPGFAGDASLEHAEIKEFTKTFHDCMTACTVDEASDGPSGAYFSVLNDAFNKSQAETSQEQRDTFQRIQKELGSSMSVAQLMATVALGFAYSQNNDTPDLAFSSLKALVSSMEPVLCDEARAKAMVTASCNLYRQGSAVLHWAKQGEAAMQQFASAMQKVASDLAACDDTDVVVKKHKGKDRLATMYDDAARFVNVYTTSDEEADMTCTVPRFASVIQDTSNENGTATLVRHVLYNVAKVYQQSVSEGNLTLEAQRRIMSSTTVGFDLIEKELAKVQASGERLNDDAAKKAIKAIDRSMTAAMKPGTTEFVHVIRPLFKVQEVGGYFRDGRDALTELDNTTYQRQMKMFEELKSLSQTCYEIQTFKIKSYSELNLMEMVKSLSGSYELESLWTDNDQNALNIRQLLNERIFEVLKGAKSVMPKGTHIAALAGVAISLISATYAYDVVCNHEDEQRRLLKDMKSTDSLCKMWKSIVEFTNQNVRLFEFAARDSIEDRESFDKEVIGLAMMVTAYMPCMDPPYSAEFYMKMHQEAEKFQLKTRDSMLHSMCDLFCFEFNDVIQKTVEKRDDPLANKSYGAGPRGPVDRLFDMWQEFSEKKAKGGGNANAGNVSKKTSQFLQAGPVLFPPANGGGGGGSGGGGGGNAACGKCVSSSLPFPLSVMCYRPYRRYLMGSGVLMESGRNTAITAYAHNDMQVGNDPQSKQTLVHFTGNFASVVLDKRRIAVAPDIFCCDYQGGEDRNYIEVDTYQDYKSNPISYVKTHGGEDIYAVPGPCLAGANISGLEFTECSRPVDISGDKFRLCCTREDSVTPGKEAMKRIYHIDDAADQYITSPQDMCENMDEFHHDVGLNTTCFQATQKILSSQGSNTNFIRGCDHFENFIGPGARNHRKGLTSGTFQAMEFERMNLEEVNF